MVIKCDVLVVGAGPAGLSTAITTSKLGLKTVLIEKSSELGYPVKTSALTWKTVIDEWGVSEKSIAQWYDKFKIVSFHSKKDVTVPFKDYVCCTLNFLTFLKELSLKSMNSKTHFLINKKVRDFTIKDEKEVTVELDDGKNIKSKIIVDASGLNAIIAKKLDLIPKHFELGIGIEYELSNAKVRNLDQFDIFVGHEEVIPIGYGWSFPVGKDKTRVGVATSIVTGKDKKINIEYYLNKFISRDSPIYPITKDSQKMEVHTGAYPVGGFFKKTYTNNVLVVGDAAGHANPLFGEGIRYALDFGKIAGSVAFDAVSKGDFSEEFLSSYQSKCESQIKDYYNVILKTSEIPTDTFWDMLIDALKYLKDAKKEDLIIKILRNEVSMKEAEEIFEFKTQ